MDFSGPIGRKVGKNHKKNCWGLDNFFTFSISYISKNLHFDALNFSLHSQMTERWHKCVVFGPVCTILVDADHFEEHEDRENQIGKHKDST